VSDNSINVAAIQLRSTGSSRIHSPSSLSATGWRSSMPLPKQPTLRDSTYRINHRNRGPHLSSRTNISVRPSS